MEKMYLIIIILLLVTGLFCQTPDWMWTSSVGDALNDIGEEIVADTFGNVYVAGTFQGTITFGTTTLTSNHNNSIFIAKIDTYGNYIWVQSLGADVLTIGGIDVDENSNLYITGSFENTLILGSLTLVSYFSNTYQSYDSSVYVAKISASGTWQWANSAEGYYDDNANDICVSSSGFAYITGDSKGSISFGTTNLTGGPNSILFIAKIDYYGQWDWAISQTGGDTTPGSNAGWGRGISLDNNMNLYVTATFRNGLFNQYQPQFGVFVGKFTSSGSLVWSKSASGNGDSSVEDITLDDNTNVFVTGFFGGSYLSFVNGPTLTNPDTEQWSIFVAGLNADGNWLWAKQAGGFQSYDSGTGIAVDSNSNVIVTGHYDSDASFGDILLNCMGLSDIFVAKLTPSGDWIYALGAGGIGTDRANSITVIGESIYLTGYFQDTIMCGEDTLISTGGYDVLLAKLGFYPISASFSVSDSFGSFPLTVQFTDTSYQGNGVLTDWLWNFGDGETSIVQNPEHTYNLPGIYSVSLSITNSQDSTSVVTVNNLIIVVNPDPELQLSLPISITFGTVNIGTQSISMSICLHNIGLAPLTVDPLTFGLPDSPFELDGTTYPFAIEYGDSAFIYLIFSPLTIGSHTDTLYIYNNSTNLPIAKIKLTGYCDYVPPAFPENVNIITVGTNSRNTRISWEAVTEDIYGNPLEPDGYLIFNCDDPYGDFNFLGFTDQLYYIHYYVTPYNDMMFYEVVSVKDYGRGLIRRLEELKQTGQIIKYKNLTSDL
jgi:PKD repeat protein